ncbi:hypothetical protein CDAR_251831 [Caerostris darwini]|uniref:Uncharacterized protein n=1 Tax=Caerostris darwini TaxID=1538125 RepID=A0AAV4U2J3_9ARAC|nr:hypothetical protein CDAR_251831 [Caerostris darwini]
MPPSALDVRGSGQGRHTVPTSSSTVVKAGIRMTKVKNSYFVQIKVINVTLFSIRETCCGMNALVPTAGFCLTSVVYLLICEPHV